VWSWVGLEWRHVHNSFCDNRSMVQQLKGRTHRQTDRQHDDLINMLNRQTSLDAAWGHCRIHIHTATQGWDPTNRELHLVSNPLLILHLRPETVWALQGLVLATSVISLIKYWVCRINYTGLFVRGMDQQDGSHTLFWNVCLWQTVRGLNVINL
jgi:hypothetical protein